METYTHAEMSVRTSVALTCLAVWELYGPDVCFMDLCYTAAGFKWRPAPSSLRLYAAHPPSCGLRIIIIIIIIIITFSASRQLLDVPRYRLSSFARRAFSVAGPSACNSLPEYLRDPAVGRNSSRKQLKTFLFATY